MPPRCNQPILPAKVCQVPSLSTHNFWLSQYTVCTCMLIISKAMGPSSQLVSCVLQPSCLAAHLGIDDVTTVATRLPLHQTCFRHYNCVQGFAGELDLGEALDRKSGPKQGGKQQGAEQRMSKKREAKNSKFGKAVLIFIVFTMLIKAYNMRLTSLIILWCRVWRQEEGHEVQ